MLNPRARAVLDALLPSGEPPLPRGLLDAGFERFHEDFSRTALPSMRLGFSASLWVAAWVAPLLIRRLPPLTRLPPQEREAALEALGKSRFYLLRQCLFLLKAMACFCYGADREVRRSLGMEAP